MISLPSRLSREEVSAGRVVTAVSAVAAGGAVGAFVAVSMLIAAVTPYRLWDAFAFGSWSRLFAESGHFQMVNSASGDVVYQRPLFYVAQGLLWMAFGFHVALGRLLSLFFSLILIGAIVLLARRRSLGWLGGLLAALLLTLVVDFAKSVDGGLSDVPAAAMVAVVAVLYREDLRPRSARFVALAPVTFLAVVSKSTTVVALAAFLAAELLGPLATLRRRALSLAPAALGIVGGVAYFVHEARVFHESLYDFLRSGNSTYYQAATDRLRTDALLRVDVLGADLRLLLWFALLYAVLRIAGAPHRGAAPAGAALAVAASWILPALSTGGSWLGPFAGGVDLHDVAYLALAAMLPLAALVPAAEAPSRLRLLRLLVWAAPVVVLWYQHAVYAPRLISPAWPPLVLLLLEGVGLLVLGGRRAAALVPLAPVAALVLLFVLAFPNVDGFGSSLWHSFWHAGPSGWTDSARMRAFALGPLDDEVNAVGAQIGDRGRVLSSDGRLRFFFGGRADDVYASSCSQLEGYRAFVLLLDPDSTTLMEQGRPGSSKPEFWQACSSPTLTPIKDVPNAFAAFAVGLPRAACANPQPQGGMRAIFGTKLSYDAAEALRKRATAVGFHPLELEPLSCSSWQVVLRGFSGPANARDFAAEARAAGFPVTIVGAP